MIEYRNHRHGLAIDVDAARAVLKGGRSVAVVILNASGEPVDDVVVCGADEYDRRKGYARGTTQVNWSAVGAQSPARARDYALLLLAAVQLAEIAEADWA